MKKFTLKAALSWLAYSFIFIWLIYRMQGESIALLPTDIKYAFVLNRKTLYAIALCLSAAAFFCFYAVMNAKKVLRFRWDVRIGGFHMKFGGLKSFYSNIDWIVRGGVRSICYSDRSSILAKHWQNS